MNTTITNPCGHQITWELRDVRDDMQVWFTSYKDGVGNTYNASHAGPGTELIRNNCPQCTWHRTLLMGVK